VDCRPEFLVQGLGLRLNGLGFEIEDFGKQYTINQKLYTMIHKP